MVTVSGGMRCHGYNIFHTQRQLLAFSSVFSQVLQNIALLSGELKSEGAESNRDDLHLSSPVQGPGCWSLSQLTLGERHGTPCRPPVCCRVWMIPFNWESSMLDWEILE